MLPSFRVEREALDDFQVEGTKQPVDCPAGGLTPGVHRTEGPVLLGRDGAGQGLLDDIEVPVGAGVCRALGGSADISDGNRPHFDPLFSPYGDIDTLSSRSVKRDVKVLRGADNPGRVAVVAAVDQLPGDDGHPRQAAQREVRP